MKSFLNGDAFSESEFDSESEIDKEPVASNRFVGKGVFARPFTLVLLATLATAIVMFLAGRYLSRLEIKAPQDCVAIDDNGARLMCYDRALVRPVSQPAKGATAPFLN
jgi:hypothetical protein